MQVEDMEGLEPPTLVREVWERFGDASVFTTSLGGLRTW